jgi:DNA-binding MarR family transcriptional regulator
MNISQVQHLIERLGNLLRTQTRNALIEHGLQPIQFEALHYLSICNRYSNTPMGVTEYLRQTKGTVSQTIKVLEKKGLVVKAADSVDKRVAHITLTDSGQRLLTTLFPSPLLTSLEDQLENNKIITLEDSLRHLLRSAQIENDFKTFGQCSTCVHNIKSSGQYFLCGLTKEKLSNSDIKLICREHQVSAAS